MKPIHFTPNGHPSLLAALLAAVNEAGAELNAKERAILIAGVNLGLEAARLTVMDSLQAVKCASLEPTQSPVTVGRA